MKIVEKPKISNKPTKKVLVLGYYREETTIIDTLIDNDCEVWHTSDKIDSLASYDLVISFGYRHIVSKNVILSTNIPLVNLHIAYLPWNRGSHPNFWSFYDGTPSGVSIHLIDEGIDTGPIIAQQKINFSKDLKTFSQTYAHLRNQIEKLFKQNINTILNGEYAAIPQKGKGTYHNSKDLPEQFAGWESDIEEEINRLHLLDEIMS